MLTLNSMTIKREGDITFMVRGGLHCGSQQFLVKIATPQGHEHVEVLSAKWTLVAICAPLLDAHGFLFDQATMGDYLAQIASHDAYDSCELLVQEMAEAFVSHVKRTVPTCVLRSVEMSISPNPYLSVITATYHDPRPRTCNIDESK